MTSRARNSRIEVRISEQDRALIDHAIQVEGSGLTDFVIRHSTDAARRVLADRDAFLLKEESLSEWERINSEPARELISLQKFMTRASPFTE